MSKKPRLGELPPRHKFILNPYPDQRISRCPLCENKTGQRKLPLMIHVEPHHFIALNYTCRYCPVCDLLIGHKHEIEHLLTALFADLEPAAIGRNYLIIGTVEKDTWKAGLTQPKGFGDVMPHVSDFEEYYSEFRITRPGWYREDQEPPDMVPPSSQEWVRPGLRRGPSRSS